MSKRLLHISADLSLPQTAVTSTIVVYGGKGQGKTNFGAVLVEELAAAGLRWSVLDPMGVWFGIRHSTDGKGSGVECLILGGAHGDIPIEPTGGAVVADLVADEAVSVVIDISRRPNGEMWSIGERIRFAADYGRQLFRRQGSLIDGQRREPICQIIDEAARFVPQTVRSGDIDVAKCCGVWSAIVEEGRNIGLGVVLLTQRSARLNKDVAELADLMLAFRTVGPNSIEAVIDWLGAHIPKAQAHSMIEQVRSLPVGSALAVSPGWLQVEKVIAIRQRQTFDSSATPRPGERAARVHGQGARPDLAVYAARMRDTIERAAADDPKSLKRQIVDLQAQLAKRQVLPVSVATIPKSVDTERIRMLTAQVATLQKTAGAYERSMTLILRQADDMAAIAGRIRDAVEAARGSAQSAQEAQAALQATVAPDPAPARQAAPARAAVPAPKREIDPDSRLSGPEQRILDSLLWFKRIGVDSPVTTAVAFMAGYTVNGSFHNARAKLKNAGLAVYLDGSRMGITDPGIELANPPTIGSSNEDLHAAVLGRLGGPERKVLTPLLAAYPNGVGTADLAEKAGYTENGSFFNARGKLKTLGLIRYDGGSSYANDLLFPNP